MRYLWEHDLRERLTPGGKKMLHSPGDLRDRRVMKD